MTQEIVAATNEVCGGVAMTYHSFKGLAWFKEHYKKLRDQLRVKLNVHLIADKNVAKNLKDLADSQDELGHLSVVLLAYYPEVGRSNLDGLMTRTVYMKRLPEAITYARCLAMDIAFSEGLLPYFLSRPELQIDTRFAMRSEGVFSCYIDPLGQMAASSFYPRPEDGATIFTLASQELWNQLRVWWGSPGGEACLDHCPFRGQCSTPTEYHYFICAFAHHNQLPLDTQDPPVDRKTRFEIISKED